MRWQRTTMAFCALASLVSAGCTGSDNPSGDPVRTDSAGVAIVLNRQDDRMLNWRFERILDLGGEDEGPTAFYRVFPTSIGVDSLDNLYVLDAGNFTVAVFDRAGNHQRSFGRQGDGPGELGFPSDMAVNRDGEAAVYDFARRALVLFDADGSFIGTFPLPGPLQRQVVFLDGGRIAAAVGWQTHSADSADYSLLLLGSDTVEIARIRRSVQQRAQQFSCTTLTSPPYFGPRVVWAAAGNRIAFSETAGYSIRIVDQNGLTAIWRRDLPGIQSTPELAAWEVAQGDSLRVRGCVVPAEQVAIRLGYTDVVPIVRGLAVAPDGAVWLRRQTGTPGELPIDVLDSEGRYVGTLPGSAPFPAVFRGSDEIVVVERDHVDIPHVVVYRIHRGF